MGQRKKELIALKGAGMRKGGKPSKCKIGTRTHLEASPVPVGKYELPTNRFKTGTDLLYKLFMDSLSNTR